MRRSPARAWRSPGAAPHDPARPDWPRLEAALRAADPRLRLARPPDGPALAVLARELAATEWADPQRDPVPPLMAFLDKPDNGLPLILVEDGALLGLCLLQRLSAPLDGGGQLCLDDLYVRVAARGRGLGGALMKGVEALGRALGVRYLYLHVEPENTAAQALYARHGLVHADSRIMDKLYF